MTKNFSDFTDRNFNMSQVHDLASGKVSVILAALAEGVIYDIQCF